MQACMCYSQSGIPHLLFVVGMWKCPWSKAHTFISTSQVSGFCWCRGGQCHLKSRCQAHREIAVDTIPDPQFYARYLSCRNQNKKNQCATVNVTKVALVITDKTYSKELKNKRGQTALTNRCMFHVHGHLRETN